MPALSRTCLQARRVSFFAVHSCYELALQLKVEADGEAQEAELLSRLRLRVNQQSLLVRSGSARPQSGTPDPADGFRGPLCGRSHG